MKRIAFLLLPLMFLAGCDRLGGKTKSSSPSPNEPEKKAVSLPDARRGFQTQLARQERENEPAPSPPAKLFRLVRYKSPAGDLAAYVSRSPDDGKTHPAILWIVGGFSNSIGETPWTKAPASNDQSASAFRTAGIAMMYPSFRGGNDNPGVKEGFYGEVDDVLAAADYLAGLDFVDPQRIYLGGHSTGGTLALLAAECGKRFRAVFSFGPAADVTGYKADNLPFRVSDRREAELRAPIRWLDSIESPVFVFEGTSGGNLASLQALSRASKNPLLHFYPVKGATHFSILAPLTRLIAGKIMLDNGTTTNLSFTEDELNRFFSR